MNNKDFDQMWNPTVIKIGAPTLLLVAAMTMLPNLYLYLAYGAIPSLQVALKAWGMIVAIFGAFYLVEPISYFPIVGLCGTYISFLTGNIGNVRIPCASVALEAAQVEGGTPEGNIVATMGLTGSVLVNLMFNTLAVVSGAAIMSHFSPEVANVFKTCTVPAIFAAVFAQNTLKQPLLTVPGLLIPFLLFISGVPFLMKAYVVVVCAVFGTIAVARILYKGGLTK